MNLQQFAALKVGDKIENAMSQSSGVVTEATDQGVKVRWGAGTPGRDVTFTYTVNGTSWFHWSKVVDDGGPGAMREMPYGA